MSCETYAKTDSHPHMTYSKFLALQTHCCWWNDVMMTPAAGEVISQIVIASFVVCIKGLEQKKGSIMGRVALHCTGQRASCLRLPNPRVVSSNKGA